MRKVWFWCAVSAALAAAAQAATVQEQKAAVSIGGDGVVREHHSLKVRLENAADLRRWARYPIYVDDNRKVVSVAAFALLPDGERLKVKRRDRDVSETLGSSYVDSAAYHLLSFPGLVEGAVLEVAYELEIEPYYPAGQIVLRGDEPITNLEVRIEGGGESWRWRLDGPTDGLEVEELAGGVRVTGADLEAVDPPRLSPAGAAVWPTLRYSWGGDGTWDHVAAWYLDLLSSLARAAPEVGAQSRELVAGIDDRRQQLEALLAFVREKVRYEAVEIGIGGYRPTPPATVLERKWGDCKDKGLLLVDLLREAGIEAHPVLLRSSAAHRIDREFPSPLQFNHLIVAVPTADMDTVAEDPVADGFLFLDPTQTRGTARWLHPANQDQTVLVIDGRGTLAQTPIREGLELRQLQVTLTVGADGTARGGAGLLIQGRRAGGLISQINSAPQERTEETARGIFGRLLPGVTIGAIGFKVKEGEVPAASLSAAVAIEGLVKEGRDGRHSFRLPGLGATPEPLLLKEREEPVVLSPDSTRITWSIALPKGWCPPPEEERTVTNDVGLFSHTVRLSESGSRFAVERRIELRRRWIEPDVMAELSELALVEKRTDSRRLWLECQP